MIMSIGRINKIYDQNRAEEIADLQLNISEIVIPFSKLIGNHIPLDVYSGSEKIPFKERDPEYKMILRQEFSSLLR